MSVNLVLALSNLFVLVSPIYISKCLKPQLAGQNDELGSFLKQKTRDLLKYFAFKQTDVFKFSELTESKKCKVLRITAMPCVRITMCHPSNLASDST